MTVISPIGSITYTVGGSPSATAFPYPFRVDAAADLTVVRANADGTLDTLTYGTDYTVSGLGEDNGTVTLAAVLGTAGLTIARRLEVTQPTSLPDEGAWYPSTAEAALDRVVMIQQQHADDIDRAVKAPLGSTVDPTLPTPVAASALGWDITGTGLTNLPTSEAAYNSALGQYGVGQGAALLAAKLRVTGGANRTQEAKNADSIDVRDFGAKFDGLTDDTAAINAATAYAHSLLIQSDTAPWGGYIRKGGRVIHMPPGKAITSGTINLYDGVTLRGAGKHSTIISSSYDGPIVQNTLTNYNAFGMGLEDFTVIGDRTKTSQTGIDLLREWWGTYRNLSIRSCGADGFHLRECINSKLDGVEVLQCVGDGLVLDEGVNSWVGNTVNGLPSNNVVVENGHFAYCDGAGIHTQGHVWGCIFNGGSAEYNYYSSGDNTGYNVLLEADSVVPCEFNDFWTEGNVQSHFYIDLPSASTVRITRLHHFGNGKTGKVDRCIIVDAGLLQLNGAFGHGDFYKEINGSWAPFRVTKADALIRARDVFGSAISPTSYAYCEDENGEQDDLSGNWFLDNLGIMYGPASYYAKSGDRSIEYYRTGDAYPCVAVDTTNRGVTFGSGAAAPSAGLSYYDTGIVRANTGVGFRLDGTWDGGLLILNHYALWVDSAGKLRIKSSTPTSDTDGTIVGTQAA